MPRDEARIYSRIWRDDDFRALDGAAQRMYCLVLSQVELNHAGVLPYRPGRWAGLCAEDTERRVRAAVTRLAAARFVVVDETTAELFIRSYVRNDRILKQPNVALAAFRQFGEIESPLIRAAWLVELARLAIDASWVVADHQHKVAFKRSGERLMELLAEPLPEGFPEGFPEGLYEGFPEGFWEGFGKPITERFAEPYL
jgi:hypothetical protein